MTAPVSVRPMAPADLDAVMAIEQGVLSAWTDAQLAAELAQDLGWQLVAEEKERSRLVGYICGRIVPPEAEIFKIAVLPEYRRQGVGRMLLRRAVSLLRQKGVRKCFLELRQSNLAAKALYEAAGFVGISVRKAYYAEPREDAVVMIKKLHEGSP